MAASDISCGTLHAECSASRLSLQYHLSTAGSCATRRHFSQSSHDTQLLNVTALACLLEVNGAASSRKRLGRRLIREIGAVGNSPSSFAICLKAHGYPLRFSAKNRAVNISRWDHLTGFLDGQRRLVRLRGCSKVATSNREEHLQLQPGSAAALGPLSSHRPSRLGRRACRGHQSGLAHTRSVRHLIALS